MIQEGSPLFKILDGIADAVNPALGICLLVFLIASTRRGEVNWRAWLAVILGVAFVYLLQRLDRQNEWWESFGGDYSSHSALALAFGLPIIFLRQKLVFVIAAVLLAYALLMMALGFHTVLDIVTTALVIVPIVLLLQYFFWLAPILSLSRSRIKAIFYRFGNR